MEPTEQISLNLDTSFNNHFKKKIEKVHVQGNRRSRIKQRREIKSQQAETDKFNQLANKVANSHGKAKSSTSSVTPAAGRKRKHDEGSRSNNNDHDDDEGDGDGGGPRKFAKPRKTEGGSIVSSLFKANPEIPVVENSVVDTLSEQVFTGKTFKELPIHPYLVSTLQEKLGFSELTQIQQKAIPVLLKRTDALIKSQTGSGKTLAYAVPIIQSLQALATKIKRDDGPYALVILPTRELALQTYNIFVKLLRTFIWIVPGYLMGGEKKKAEKSRLRKGMNILVTTPGRLLDHINTTDVLSLARVHWLVIDEADRLLELGFERDVAQILNALKSECPSYNTVLLSATLSEGVERLSSITLKDPVHVSINSDENTPTLTPTQQSSNNGDSNSNHKDGSNPTTSFSVPSQLNQHFIITPCKLRLVTLASMILWKCRYSEGVSKMVVFMSTTHSVTFHYHLFNKVINRNTIDAPEDHKFGPAAAKDNWATAKQEEKDIRMGRKKQRTTKCLPFFQLHGEMKQKERTEAFHTFAKAKGGVLLCTDVAARGLDLPKVDWIIQYTLPGQTVDYIHRIGRTARAGSQGQSLLFLMPSEVDYVQELNKHNLSLAQMDNVKMLRKLLSNIKEFVSDQMSTSTRQMPRTLEEAATFVQDRFEEILLKDTELIQLAAKGFQSYVRAYSTYSKEVKAVLKAKELHLGHVAKSFGLREAPSQVHGIAAKARNEFVRNKKEFKKNSILASHRPLSFKQAALSEYASGLNMMPSKAKPKKKGGKKKK